MMRNRLGAVLFAVGLAVASTAPASAVTLPVIGGPGLDQGVFCLSGQCPGTPTSTLTAPAAVTGSVTYDEGASTVDITLTLTEDATFAGFLVTMFAGTTFVATGVPVMAFPFGGGAIQIVQIGAASGQVSPLTVTAPGGLGILADTPSVSGLTCSIGTGSDQCGVSFGPTGLSFDSPGLGDLDAFVTFNVNVPEPGTLVTLAFGVAGLAFMGGRRRA